jgi:DNA-binding NarL/FixJ family response regulator
VASRGWEQKALRHVEQVGPCVERGYLALALTGCEIHDPRELRERAEVALTVAVEFGDHDLEVRALGDKGLALVCQGYVDEGFALLDEVMVAITAGEVSDGEVRAMTVCALLTACERTGDQSRAEYWCRKIDEDPRLREIGIVVTQCAIVFGCVEALRGHWESAEKRFLEAAQARSTTIYHQSDAIARLAELRIQQGRYAEAAETLRGYEDEFEVAPVVARLRLVEGNYAQAASLLRGVARGLGGDTIRLGPLLALLVEVELRSGDVLAATRAARRLNSLEDNCGSNEIRAMARLGQARLALHRNDHEAAIDDLETALTLLIHRDRPLLTAQIRLELARALAQAGEEASARIEAEAALATFHKLGVVPDLAPLEDFLGQVATSGATEAYSGSQGDAVIRYPMGAVESLTPRENEVARLVAKGLANKAIASQLTLSVRTVESHVDRTLGKLDLHNRTQLATWVQRGAG